MSFALFVSYGFSIIFISLSADFIITYSGRAKTIIGIANTAVSTPLAHIITEDNVFLHPIVCYLLTIL